MFAPEMAESIRDWPSRLKHNEPAVRDQAISELREFLVRGLAKSLSNRYGGRVCVEDIAQVSLSKILSAIDSFAGRSRFETWAMSIATRTGISELRKHYYKTVNIGALSDDSPFQIDFAQSIHADQDKQSELLSLIQLLNRIIEEKLSQRQRIAIRGVLAGLAIEVIADRLSSNRNAIYKLVHDSKMKIKLGFEQSGMTADEIQSILS